MGEREREEGGKERALRQVEPNKCSRAFLPGRVDIAFYIRHIDRVAPFEWGDPAEHVCEVMCASICVCV